VLKKVFTDLSKKYTNNLGLIEKLWNEIHKAYSSHNRHYHTLAHLTNLLSELNEVQKEIKDWDAVLFAFFYHDIVYRVTEPDSEEKSAGLGRQRLMELAFSGDKIDRSVSMILATKTHTATGDNDTDYFTDADLSILGHSWNLYVTYCKGIRKEYAIYPDFIYNVGRKKVIEYFLQMPQLFKTKHFFKKFEEQARQNLLKEYNSL
jgi:predicted metal-dependent HD superfamily phosphohydrolase